MHRITGSGSDRGSVRKSVPTTTSVVVEEKVKNLDLKNGNDSISININEIDKNNNKKNGYNNINDINIVNNSIANNNNNSNNNNNQKCLDCIAVAPEGK
jgi:hypothetical protein